MSVIDSTLIGLIQGLTEFFPVSSSAHLWMAETFLGRKPDLALHLSCHLGTLAASVRFFRKEIREILFEKRDKLLLFFVAGLPLLPLYFLLAPLREYGSREESIGLFLIMTGGILLAGQSFSPARSEKKGRLTDLRDSFLVGISQSFALIPGISRSASTISCARMLGWEVKEAVRFSFLLSIPTVFAGNLRELGRGGIEPGTSMLPLFVGFAVSFLTGTIVIGKAMQWLERGDLRPCAIYCFFLGTAVTLYFNL